MSDAPGRTRAAILLSWFGTSAAILVLGYLVWVRFVDPTRGEWHPEIIGKAVGKPPLESQRGDPILLEHPAMIYFFRMDCAPCENAAHRLAEFAESGRRTDFKIYAITPDRVMIAQSALRPLPANIVIGRLLRGSPTLTFVRDVPLIVRTDKAGIVVKAYVGIPKRAVLEGRLSPELTA